MIHVHAVRLIPQFNDTTLLMQRAFDDSQGGMWEFLGGGVDVGEDGIPEDEQLALRREVTEESGLVVVGELIHLTFVNVTLDSGRHLREDFYLGHVEGELALSHEHEAGVFVPTQSLNALELPVARTTKMVLQSSYADIRAYSQAT